MSILHEGERLDDLHRNGLKIIQNPNLFCFGMDAVLLSAFAKVHKNERHLDLCCGNGIIPILMSAKNPGVFAGLEVQEVLADMARRSVERNGLKERVQIFCGDLRSFDTDFHYDAITANPPYISAEAGLLPVSYENAVARHEILCTLEDVTKAAAKLLRFGGRFYMVHRPGRLADIFSALRGSGLEPKTLRFVQPKTHAAPNMLLVMAAKGGRPHLDVRPPLVIYKSDGSYTKEVSGIYYE